MLHKFLWWKLETGCLALACVSTLYALMVFIYGLCVYEDFEHMSEAWVLRMFTNEVSENAVRVSFIIMSILDIASSALLAYGIVKVNRNMIYWMITKKNWKSTQKPTLAEWKTKMCAFHIVCARQFYFSV